MAITVIDKAKGKDFSQSPSKEHPLPLSRGSTSSSSDSDSDTDTDGDSSEYSSSDSDEEVTQEYLDSLLERARQNAIASSSRKQTTGDAAVGEEEVIQLGGDETKEDEQPLPSLEPSSLPQTYIELGDSKFAGPSKLRDLDAERAEKASSSLKAPEVPKLPVELTASGKPLTKKEKKALKNKTAGPGWFDLPAPVEADLPKLYREYEALRLRNQLDPKRFYRKEEGESKGIKGLPKHFAIGTIVPESSPFGGASGENLARTQRKRTLVDELVDDAEAKSYAKKKFKELQTVRGAKGRGTLARKKASRKPKW